MSNGTLQNVPTHVDLARLAREIAMDIQSVDAILSFHNIDDETWEKIYTDPRFQTMLASMIADWHSADNVRKRVQVKAATGFESLLETYIIDARDSSIPLAQRVEVGKLLVKIGELEAQQGGPGGSQVLVQINMGAGAEAPPPEIKVVAIPPREPVPA